MQEEKLIKQYSESHPEATEVPESAYQYKQDSPLTQEQLKELKESERFSYNSVANTSFFIQLKKVEDMYFKAVRDNPAANAPLYLKYVNNKIVTELETKNAQEVKDAKEQGRAPKKFIAEKLEYAVRRFLKSSIKEDQIGGGKSIHFKRKLFKAASDKEKQDMAKGLVQFPHPQIEKICKGNGLKYDLKTFNVYRYASAEELAANPDMKTLQLMSVGEAHQLLSIKNKGHNIGQTVFAVRPFLIPTTGLTLLYSPEAFIYWAPGNAYPEARVFSREKAVQPAPAKRIVPKGIVAVSAPTAEEVASFNAMSEIPKAFKYEKAKKEEGKEEAKPA